MSVGDWDPYLARLPDIEMPRLDPNAPVARALIEQIKKEISGTALQDGLLKYYKDEIVPFADANVERRLESEPYQWPYGKPRGCSLK